MSKKFSNWKLFCFLKISLPKLIWNPFILTSFWMTAIFFVLYAVTNTFDRGDLVCVIYKTSLAYLIARTKINTINWPRFDIIAFNFHYSKSKFSRFICTYLPPSKFNDEVTIKTLLKVLKCLVCPELYVFGDFNFSRNDWKNPSLAIIGKLFNLNEDIIILSHAKSLENRLEPNKPVQKDLYLLQVKSPAVFLRVLFWVHFSFWFSLKTSSEDY